MAELKNIKETYDACVEIINSCVDTLNEYIKIQRKDPDAKLYMSLDCASIAEKMFLKGDSTSMDYQTKRLYLRKLLDISKDDVIMLGTYKKDGGEDGDSKE